MPLRIAVFNCVQLAACLYALKHGGAPERWTAWMMAAGAALTATLPSWSSIRFDMTSPTLLLVDLALLGGLCWLAARANRFWPLWVAALQLVAIAVHVVRGLDPTILPAAYNQTVGKVAYPMILLLVLGTFRHSQRERTSTDDDWSPLRW